MYIVALRPLLECIINIVYGQICCRMRRHERQVDKRKKRITYNIFY